MSLPEKKVITDKEMVVILQSEATKRGFQWISSIPLSEQREILLTAQTAARDKEWAQWIWNAICWTYPIEADKPQGKRGAVIDLEIGDFEALKKLAQEE